MRALIGALVLAAFPFLPVNVPFWLQLER